MSKNGLHRHYDKLEPEERFRLDVLAMARGDMQESERLVRSCNRQTYTMNDRRFTVRWSAAENVTLRMCVPLVELLGQLRLLDAFRAMIPYQQTVYGNMTFDAYYKGHEAGSYHAWNAAGQTGHPPAWPKGDDPEEIWEPDEDERDPAMERDEAELEAAAEKCGEFLPEVLDRLERKCVGGGITLWTGYAAFCEECARVAPEKVAGVILAPIMGSIEDMKGRAERLGVEADAGTVEEFREGLAEIWRTMEERGI